MDGLNLDPGLRQAYTKQTYQRLLTESTHARITKRGNDQKPRRKESKQLTFSEKLRLIGQIIRDSGSDILTVIKNQQRGGKSLTI